MAVALTEIRSVKRPDRVSIRSAQGGYHESTHNGDSRNDLFTDRAEFRAYAFSTGDKGASGAKFCTTTAAIQLLPGQETVFSSGFSAALNVASQIENH